MTKMRGHQLLFYTPKIKIIANRESFLFICHLKRITISTYNTKDKMSFISQNQRISREKFLNYKKKTEIT